MAGQAIDGKFAVQKQPDIAGYIPAWHTASHVAALESPLLAGKAQMRQGDRRIGPGHASGNDVDRHRVEPMPGSRRVSLALGKVKGPVS